LPFLRFRNFRLGTSAGFQPAALSLLKGALGTNTSMAPISDELIESATHVVSVRSHLDDGRPVIKALFATSDGRYLLRHAIELAPRAYAVHWESCSDETARELVHAWHQGSDWVGGVDPQRNKR
jgi:hypothetical protein